VVLISLYGEAQGLTLRRSGEGTLAEVSLPLRRATAPVAA